MSHFRRRKPKKQSGCGLCSPWRRVGNGMPHHRHFRAIEGRDPLYYEQRKSRHKVLVRGTA